MKINRDINYAKERQTTEITSYYVNYEKNDGNQIITKNSNIIKN